MCIVYSQSVCEFFRVTIVNRFLSVNQIQVTSSRDCFELSTLAWRITSMCRSSEGISSSSQDRGEKRTHITAVSSSGIWLGQPRRKIITVSSPPLCVRHLSGGDPLDAQEPPGSERSMRTSSPRTWGSTRHGGRLRDREVWHRVVSTATLC